MKASHCRFRLCAKYAVRFTRIIAKAGQPFLQSFHTRIFRRTSFQYAFTQFICSGYPISLICIVLGSKIKRNLLNMDICTPRIITTLYSIKLVNRMSTNDQLPPIRIIAA